MSSGLTEERKQFPRQRGWPVRRRKGSQDWELKGSSVKQDEAAQRVSGEHRALKVTEKFQLLLDCKKPQRVSAYRCQPSPRPCV